MVSVLALKLLLLHMNSVGIGREILVSKDLHNQTSVQGIYGCAQVKWFISTCAINSKSGLDVHLIKVK